MTSTQTFEDETSNVNAVRAASAERIRSLSGDMVRNVIELGKQLIIARETFPLIGAGPKRKRPGWYQWVKRECSITPKYSYAFIAIAEKFRDQDLPPNLSMSVLRILSDRNMSDEAVGEIIEQAKTGKKVTRKDAAKAKKKHSLPSPKAANEQAREEKRPILASDGYIYFGSDPEKAKAGEDRRTMVYGVRKALETLAAIELTPTQFLNYALPHQLWQGDESQVIKQSLRWLTGLDTAWEKWEPK